MVLTVAAIIKNKEMVNMFYSILLSILAIDIISLGIFALGLQLLEQSVLEHLTLGVFL